MNELQVSKQSQVNNSSKLSPLQISGYHEGKQHNIINPYPNTPSSFSC